ncbi:MAG: phosphodiester glycosidase family protein [Hyphomicrobium sp.]
MKSRLFRNAAIALMALTCFSSAALPEPGAPNVCTLVAFEDQKFTACNADLAHHDIRLFLTRADGSNFGQLGALPREALLFATNAGMFTPEYAPAGLFVENGSQVRPLNTSAGSGNFHLQPNGVFWIANGKAAVSTTADYAARAPVPYLATQSGPMLVVDGKLHPKFDENGTSRYIRNGIGVARDGTVQIAISEQPVSFGVFARFFRDHLQCPNALYFDGSVSRLLFAGDTRRDVSGPALGPLLAVYAKAKK